MALAEWPKKWRTVVSKLTEHPWPMITLNVIINAVTPTLHSGNWLSSWSSLTPQIGIMKMLSFPGSEARGGGCPVPTNPFANPPASVCESAAGRAMTDSWVSPLGALVPVPWQHLPSSVGRVRSLLYLHCVLPPPPYHESPLNPMGAWPGLTCSASHHMSWVRMMLVPPCVLTLVVGGGEATGLCERWWSGGGGPAQV